MREGSVGGESEWVLSFQFQRRVASCDARHDKEGGKELYGGVGAAEWGVFSDS